MAAVEIIVEEMEQEAIHRMEGQILAAQMLILLDRGLLAEAEAEEQEIYTVWEIIMAAVAAMALL